MTIVNSTLIAMIAEIETCRMRSRIFSREMNIGVTNAKTIQRPAEIDEPHKLCVDAALSRNDRTEDATKTYFRGGASPSIPTAYWAKPGGEWLVKGTNRLQSGKLSVALCMALIFQADDQGHLRPKIRCDSCGGIIENYADGVALLDTPGAKPGAITEPIFHCLGCEEKIQKTTGPRPSMPIDHFMLYVLNNIQLTPKALETAGQKMKATSDF